MIILKSSLANSWLSLSAFSMEILWWHQIWYRCVLPRISVFCLQIFQRWVLHFNLRTIAIPSIRAANGKGNLSTAGAAFSISRIEADLLILTNSQVLFVARDQGMCPRGLRNTSLKFNFLFCWIIVIFSSLFTLSTVLYYLSTWFYLELVLII